MNTTHGKVLRIHKDGSVPTDNPYYGEGGVQELFWGIGLRNPYTMNIHRESSTIFINDVGKDEWEEINDASQSNRNFGWPIEEGLNTTSTSVYDEPTYAYPHFGEQGMAGDALTGGAFYETITPMYPQEYVNKYFFIDFNKQWINTITPEFDGHDHIHDLSDTRETFGTDIPRGGVYLKLSPDGYFYYFSRIYNVFYKIDYYEGNEPIVLQSPEDTVTMDGERTRFELRAAGAETLNYEWFRDGNRLNNGPNSNVYSFGGTHSGYEGEYQVRVFNNFGEAWSDFFYLTVVPYDAPADVTLSYPLSTSLYQAGETIYFEASATDIVDGEISSENFEWFVEFLHNDHIHDGPSVASGVRSGYYTIPDAGETSSNVWFRFIVKVRDNFGQITEESVEIFPKTTEVTFLTSPESLQVNIDGPSYETPTTKVFVENLILEIGSPDFQIIDGENAIYRLSHWSEVLNEDFYTIPEENLEITAFFERCTNPDMVLNFDSQVLDNTVDSILFNWEATNPPCIKGFILENENTGEEFHILADKDLTSYSLTIANNLLSNVEYRFRIKSYNEYGESMYNYNQITLGTEEYELDTSNIFLSPNPTRNIVEVKGMNFNSNYKIDIYDMLGKHLNGLVSIEELEDQLYINATNLPNGLYIIQLIMNDSKINLKLIKN